MASFHRLTVQHKTRVEQDGSPRKLILTFTNRRAASDTETALIIAGYNVQADYGYKLFASEKEAMEEINFWMN